MAVYYVLVDSGPNLARIEGATAVAGFLYGLYSGWNRHGDWGDAIADGAATAGGIAWAAISVAADWLQHFAPNSTALAVIVFIVRWPIGLNFAILGGIGAGFGSALSWGISDVLLHLQVPDHGR